MSQAAQAAQAVQAVNDLRRMIQRFVRAFGLLAGDQTPCGQPLPPSHAHALMVLLEQEESSQPEGLNQQALAEAVGLDKSSITRLCARMMSAGHLHQAPSQTDGRAWTLGLSAKGRRVAKTVQEASLARFRRLAAALPESVPVADAIRVMGALTAAAMSGAEKETP